MLSPAEYLRKTKKYDSPTFSLSPFIFYLAMPDTQIFIDLLIEYRYLAVFVLACIEGPIVALAVGFLTSLGFFSPVLALIALVLGDIIPDSVYYAVGRFGGKMEIVEKLENKYEFVRKNRAKLEHFWHTHLGKTMLITKLAYGISIPLLLLGGLVKTRFRKFLLWSTLISIFQYGVLILFGYVLGESFEKASFYLENMTMLITLFIAVILGVYYIQRRLSNSGAEIIKTEI
ncbi:MAG: hypothetical protein COV07_02190 [Candidatus Vogelbacteria bacterium CG10_big_fil_rev_8_21_14_0_10_45_14]|uniref:DedA family protein n=1 Tax=Candidatus Vogelbacteria bacterium CG10_big_fil_rev_8_21_14_0_10_45_14 TaxID=1975042 RepID=A0A2H0RJW2_9BACT|nr:MAG: hypothetical protein COV07_02190 [Candidatus Vogelbacteria bacterium CG10_big_fil_rev_8_21_14_0_10_45_14]